MTTLDLSRFTPLEQRLLQESPLTEYEQGLDLRQVARIREMAYRQRQGQITEEEAARESALTLSDTEQQALAPEGMVDVVDAQRRGIPNLVLRGIGLPQEAIDQGRDAYSREIQYQAAVEAVTPYMDAEGRVDIAQARAAGVDDGTLALLFTPDQIAAAATAPQVAQTASTPQTQGPTGYTAQLSALDQLDPFQRADLTNWFNDVRGLPYVLLSESATGPGSNLAQEEALLYNRLALTRSEIAGEVSSRRRYFELQVEGRQNERAAFLRSAARWEAIGDTQAAERQMVEAAQAGERITEAQRQLSAYNQFAQAVLPAFDQESLGAIEALEGRVLGSGGVSGPYPAQLPLPSFTPSQAANLDPQTRQLYGVQEFRPTAYYELLRQGEVVARTDSPEGATEALRQGFEVRTAEEGVLARLEPYRVGESFDLAQALQERAVTAREAALVFEPLDVLNSYAPSSSGFDNLTTSGDRFPQRIIPEEEMPATTDLRQQEALAALQQQGYASVEDGQVLVDVVGATRGGSRALLEQAGFSGQFVDTTVETYQADVLELQRTAEAERRLGQEATARNDAVAELQSQGLVSLDGGIYVTEALRQGVDESLLRQAGLTAAQIDQARNAPQSPPSAAPEAPSWWDVFTQGPSLAEFLAGISGVKLRVPENKEDIKGNPVLKAVGTVPIGGVFVVPAASGELLAQQVESGGFSAYDRDSILGQASRGVPAPTILQDAVNRQAERDIASQLIFQTPFYYAAGGVVGLAGRSVRVSPTVARTNTVTVGTSSPRAAALSYLERVRSGQDGQLFVAASYPNDAAHLARGIALKREMEDAVIAAGKRIAGETDEAVAQRVRPAALRRTVEIRTPPNPQKVLGMVQMEERLTVPSAVLQRPLNTRKVIVVEETIGKERIAQVVKAARDGNIQAVTVRSIAPEGQSAAHTAADRLTSRLKRAGIQVDRERLAQVQLAREGEAGQVMVQRADVGLEAPLDLKARQAQLIPGATRLGPGEALVALPGRQGRLALVSGPSRLALPAGQAQTLASLLRPGPSGGLSGGGGGGKVRMLVTRDGRLVPETEIATEVRVKTDLDLNLPVAPTQAPLTRPAQAPPATRTAVEAPVRAPARTRVATPTQAPARPTVVAAPVRQASPTTTRQAQPAVSTPAPASAPAKPSTSPTVVSPAEPRRREGRRSVSTPVPVVGPVARPNLQPVLAPTPVMVPAPFPQPAPVALTSPAPAPAPLPQPLPAPQPVPMPVTETRTELRRPTRTPPRPPRTGPPRPPGGPPRRSGGDSRPGDGGAGTGLYAERVGFNTGVTDLEVDLRSGERDWHSDLEEVPEIPARESFTVLEYGRRPSPERVFPMGKARVKINAAGVRFKGRKPKQKVKRQKRVRYESPG